MNIPVDILVFFHLLWFTALMFWVIRKGVEPLWKILPFLLFVFYIWQNHTLFSPIWKSLQANYVQFLLSFAVHLGQTILKLIPYAWAIVFVIAFYMIDEANAEKMMKFMVYITVFVWIIWLVNYFFGESLGPFLKREIPKFLP